MQRRAAARCEFGAGSAKITFPFNALHRRAVPLGQHPPEMPLAGAPLQQRPAGIRQTFCKSEDLLPLAPRHPEVATRIDRQRPAGKKRQRHQFRQLRGVGDKRG